MLGDLDHRLASAEAEGMLRRKARSSFLSVVVVVIPVGCASTLPSSPDDDGMLRTTIATTCDGRAENMRTAATSTPSSFHGAIVSIRSEDTGMDPTTRFEGGDETANG